MRSFNLLPKIMFRINLLVRYLFLRVFSEDDGFWLRAWGNVMTRPLKRFSLSCSVLEFLIYMKMRMGFRNIAG
jgi:hypothetical protein